MLPSKKYKVFERLNQVEKLIALGYSDDNWWDVSDIIVELRNYLSPKSTELLSEVWSTFYVYPDLDVLNKQFKVIRNLL